MVWVIMFAALMIMGRYGVDGLKDAGTVGALVVAGFGVRSFLNAFWKHKEEGNQEPEKHYWDGPGFRITRTKKGLSLSSNTRRFFSPSDGSVVSAPRYAEEERSHSSASW